ncbi:hypothetical protein NL108_012835 [Boleophthalmus pectinirostris]|uniref:cystatin-C-like n=1 Tax=Boleophthalmus pectinirostris TaxID=150288 RepID=UPI000A1C1EDB|nr:cystatin-C-like [Boleophthalmus pectinirostris]KAJ0067117.1 hypothetical protein NL108_012835 [Boleophthalmus pectinirostris]
MLVLLFVTLCLSVCSLTTAQTMTGQPRDISTRNSKVWRAAQFAVRDFNHAHNHQPFSYKILSVTSAKVQVVAGINYIMEVQLRRVCKKELTKKCQSTPEELHCSFTVTEIPWQGKRFVYRRNCVPQKHF